MLSQVCSANSNAIFLVVWKYQTDEKQDFVRNPQMAFMEENCINLTYGNNVLFLQKSLKWHMSSVQTQVVVLGWQFSFHTRNRGKKSCLDVFLKEPFCKDPSVNFRRGCSGIETSHPTPSLAYGVTVLVLSGCAGWDVLMWHVTYLFSSFLKNCLYCTSSVS